MLHLGSNATQVRHHFMQKTQKLIMQQDIQNICNTSNAHSQTESDDVQPVVSMLQVTDNANVRIVAGEDTSSTKPPLCVICSSLSAVGSY